MLQEARLRIVLQNPVAGLLYGLQKGKGPGYETILAQHGKGEDLVFDFAIQVRRAKGELPALGGPFVQGTPGNRFVYIGIGSYAGQAGAPWNGRLKVPLPEANFSATSAGDGSCTWSCPVPGSDEQGKPVFATIKSFEGWQMHKHSE